MDTEQIIEAAQAPDAFDVLAFVEDTAYPTETVVVYKDVKSAAEYVKLNKRRFELDAAKQDTTEIDAKVEAVGAKLSDSAIIFELRGMPPGVVQEFLKAPANEEDVAAGDIERDNKLIAATIIGVSNSKGTQDSRIWQADDVAKLRKFLNEGEFSKLVGGVSSVNFNSAIMDQATDAGFSGRSSDVA